MGRLSRGHDAAPTQCSCGNISSWRNGMYKCVMTPKYKIKKRKVGEQHGGRSSACLPPAYASARGARVLTSSPIPVFRKTNSASSGRVTFFARPAHYNPLMPGGLRRLQQARCLHGLVKDKCEKCHGNPRYSGTIRDTSVRLGRGYK